MAVIMTGKSVGLAYLKGAVTSPVSRIFDEQGDILTPQVRGFAGLSAFADNLNHPPAGFDGAVTWDAGLDLLFRIAGRG